jgi:hypothetical protein
VWKISQEVEGHLLDKKSISRNTCPDVTIKSVGKRSSVLGEHMCIIGQTERGPTFVI